LFKKIVSVLQKDFFNFIFFLSAAPNCFFTFFGAYFSAEGTNADFHSKVRQTQSCRVSRW